MAINHFSGRHHHECRKRVLICQSSLSSKR